MIYTREQTAKLLGVQERYLVPSNIQHIVKGAKLKGFQLTWIGGRGKNSQFEIIKIEHENILNEQWKPYPLATDYLVSNMGRVKHPQGYLLQGTKNKGYIRVRIKDQGQVFLHRIVMITFNPIENAEHFSVDHINGIKDDNRLENLRWVYQSENMQFCIENNTQMKEIIAQLVQKYGYEETKAKLLQLL